VENGDLLVDGGLLNNVPADIMMEMIKGKIIAVNVSPEVDLTVASHICECPPALQLIGERFKAQAARTNIPGLFSLLMRASMINIGGVEDKLREHADLCLHVPLKQFRLTDYNAIEQIVDTGYSYAKQEIEKWISKGSIC
jgi:predicted acylesterase/phospholipase RssA